MTISTRWFLCGSVALAGCAPSVYPAAQPTSGPPAIGETRTVVLPPRPADCSLELVSVQAADMAPGARFGGGDQYQMIGVIGLGLDPGVDVMSESVRALVRPRVCAMGGEVVSLLSGGDDHRAARVGRSTIDVVQTSIVFTVWAHTAAAVVPQKF
jgi:hypothetical protein